MGERQLREELETLYARYNKFAFIHPDPLEVVYRYDARADRELAGFVAAALAYGRVEQILKSVDAALEPLGESPKSALLDTRPGSLRKYYRGFKHRWTTDTELTDLFVAIRAMLLRYGSFEQAFLSHHDPESGNTLAGLGGMIGELAARRGKNSLLSSPEKGSACKRLHLFLRWMVRSDAVDPGCWTGVDPAALVVPLDTHMHRLGLALGLTRRRNAGIKTALELTHAFRNYAPHDPVRYDFALTRLGIHPALSPDAYLETLGPALDRSVQKAVGN